MNSFMCRLTGGHKYDDSKMTIDAIPDDVSKVWVCNRCVKCGSVFIDVVDIDRMLQADIKRSDNTE